MPFLRKRKARGSLVALYRKLKFQRPSVNRTLLHVRRNEVKYLDTQVMAAAAPATGGNVYCINLIAQGLAYNNRVARQVQGSYIQVDYYIIPPLSSGEIDTGLMAVVYDNQPNALTPSYGDIWDVTGLFPSMTFRNNVTNRERFTILKSWIIGPCDHVADLQRTRGRIFIKIQRNIGVSRYSNDNAAVPQSGAFFITIASLANTHDTQTSFAATVSSRFAFTDA